MRPTRQVARLSERAATLAGFVANEDRGRSIAVFNLSFCTFSTPILYQRIPSSRSRTATKARTFNAIRTLSLHGVTRKSGPLRMGTTDHQLLDKRKSDPKRRAAMIAIFCRYQPMVRLDNGARDGQPHAHAFGLAGEKRHKDFF